MWWTPHMLYWILFLLLQDHVGGGGVHLVWMGGGMVVVGTRRGGLCLGKRGRRIWLSMKVWWVEFHLPVENIIVAILVTFAQPFLFLLLAPMSENLFHFWGLCVTVCNNFIESQKYHVRSAYGISSDYYQFNSESPTQGSGQGLSWAGPRWINTGSNISDVMEKQTQGCSSLILPVNW